MKRFLHMKFRNLLFILFLSISLSAQQQWVNVSPFEDYKGGISGCFINVDQGWVMQTSMYKANTLYYTNDGAEIFEQIFQFDDSLTRFSILQMMNENIGYAKVKWRNNQSPYNDTTYLAKTTDGGYTWNNILIDTSFLNQLYYSGLDGKFYFTDTLTGFTTQALIVEGGVDMVISKTIDGGKTWKNTNILDLEEVGLSIDNFEYVDKFFFYDDLHGWASCGVFSDGGMCLSTTDGGENWYPCLPLGTPYFGIHFISPQKGGIVGHSFFSSVYLTNDNFQSISYENQLWPQYAKTI